MYRYFVLFLILIIISFATILLLCGPVMIPFGEIVDIFVGNIYDSSNADIILLFRVPKIVTAFLATGALAVAGLLMQTFFRNPIAGPFVLGINSGASLGVALWIFVFSLLSFNIHNTSFLNYLFSFGILGSSIIGGGAVLLLLLIISLRVSSNVLLLVLGLLFSHMTTGVISVLINISDAQKIKSFMLWSLGSFSRVAGHQLIIFSTIIIVAVFMAFILSKHLNIMLLGDDYAKNLGLQIKKFKVLILTITAVVAGTVTSFCGPIAFVGVIIPHVANGVIKSSDHKKLIPGSFLLGGAVGLLAEIISSLILPSLGLPINAVMGLLGAPLICIFMWGWYRERSFV